MASSFLSRYRCHLAHSLVSLCINIHKITVSSMGHLSINWFVFQGRLFFPEFSLSSKKTTGRPSVPPTYFTELKHSFGGWHERSWVTRQMSVNLTSSLTPWAPGGCVSPYFMNRGYDLGSPFQYLSPLRAISQVSATRHLSALLWGQWEHLRRSPTSFSFPSSAESFSRIERPTFHLTRLGLSYNSGSAEARALSYYLLPKRKHCRLLCDF